jgi:hypothetical protein
MDQQKGTRSIVVLGDPLLHHGDGGHKGGHRIAERGLEALRLAQSRAALPSSTERPLYPDELADDSILVTTEVAFRPTTYY